MPAIVIILIDNSHVNGSQLFYSNDAYDGQIIIVSPIEDKTDRLGHSYRNFTMFLLVIVVLSLDDSRFFNIIDETK